MDPAAHIQQLRAEAAAAQRELADTKSTLSAVVEEYQALEGDYGVLEKQSNVVREAFVSTSRIFFAGIRAMWADLCRKGGPVGEPAQRSLTAALGHLDRVQRVLVAAGLSEVASAATEGDSDALLKAAAAGSADDGRAAEREGLVSALLELEARVGGLEEEASAHARARAEAERELEHVRVTASAGLGFVVLGDRRYDGGSIAALLSTIQSLEGQAAAAAASLHATRVQADAAVQRAVDASGAREAEAAVGSLTVQLDAALRRVAEGDARAGRLESELRSVEVAAARREADLRSSTTSLEQAKATLTRSLAAVRLELETLQDRHASQAGVMNVLRQEIGDKEGALQRAIAGKAAQTSRAAAALRDVEGQVAQLAAAVVALQAQKAGHAAAGS